MPLIIYQIFAYSFKCLIFNYHVHEIWELIDLKATLHHRLEKQACHQQCLSEFDTIFYFYTILQQQVKSCSVPLLNILSHVPLFFWLWLVLIFNSPSSEQPPSTAQQIKIFSTSPSCKKKKKVSKQTSFEKLTMPLVKCQSEFMSPAEEGCGCWRE